MRSLARVSLVLAIASTIACAQKDWIDRTLVTVDVTGVWTATPSNNLWLELKQEGSKVRGSYDFRGYWAHQERGGPLGGTVAGDVFRFKAVNGNLTGELTVSGDEMSGQLGFPVGRLTSIRRVSPASQPGQQRQ